MNEERTIAAAIAAARTLVSEVVVVDSGSTDATVAIAQSLGARVVHRPWLGSGRQKRFAEDQCRHDFVLDLDADEIVSPALAAELRALFRGGPPPLPVYALKLVIVPPVGRPWWNVGVAHRRKLYNRRVVRQPDHVAWDQLQLDSGVPVGRLSAPLMHHMFRDIEHMVRKLNAVSSVRARQTRLHRGRLEVGARVIFAYPVYFLKHYMLRRYYRLGVYGVATAATLAYGRWLRDAKMYERLLAERSRARVAKTPGADAAEEGGLPQPSTGVQ